jgi:hypothetical protein
MTEANAMRDMRRRNVLIIYTSLPNLGAHFRESSLLRKVRRSTSSDSTAMHEVARILNQIDMFFGGSRMTGFCDD